jgi:signal peptidase II
MGVVVAVDQLAKAAIIASLSPRETLHVFFALDLTHIRNTGVAFGMFAGLGTPVVLLSTLALLVPLVYFVKNPTQTLLWLPVGMIFGGALGNLADRERAGAVIDFIAVSVWPAFNLADACIVVGVIGLLYAIERSSRRRSTK